MDKMMKTKRFLGDCQITWWHRASGVNPTVRAKPKSMVELWMAYQQKMFVFDVCALALCPMNVVAATVVVDIFLSDAVTDKDTDPAEEMSILTEEMLTLTTHATMTKKPIPSSGSFHVPPLNHLQVTGKGSKKPTTGKSLVKTKKVVKS